VSGEKQFSGLAEDVKQKLEKLLMRAGQSPRAEKLANSNNPSKSPGQLNSTPPFKFICPSLLSHSPKSNPINKYLK